jgi:hypothetical protein
MIDRQKGSIRWAIFAEGLYFLRCIGGFCAAGTKKQEVALQGRNDSPVTDL